MKTKRKGWGFPVLLGVATAFLLAMALWPEEAQTRTIIVAARDLGAGTVLQASDIRQITVDAVNAPTDASRGSETLVGETLIQRRLQSQ